MPWKEMTIDELDASMGIDVQEAREKFRLINLIKKARKDGAISQATLAKKVGVTQGRIAQIESQIGVSKVTFDVLFGILRELGFELKVVAKKVA